MDGERSDAGNDIESREDFEQQKAGAPIARATKVDGPAVRIVKLGVAFAILAGGVAFLLTTDETPLVYSQMVDEVMAAPSTFEGRALRVEGLLRPGSIQFREDPCEWRFTIERNDRALDVEFPECIVPDTFRDGTGITVVVEGRLDGERFHATQVIPRCPSKYEMNERMQNGESAPHSLTPS